MVADRDDDSILTRVTPHGSAPEDVTAYEVTVDLLGQVIGLLAVRIGEVERTEPVDAREIASLRERQAHYASLRRDLRPADRARVTRLRQECAAIIRDFDAAR